MKEPVRTSTSLPVCTDDDIRAYAHHLYVQSGRVAGRALDHWLEAEACLRAVRAAPPAYDDGTAPVLRRREWIIASDDRGAYI